MIEGWLRPHQSELSLLQRLIDAALISIAFWLAHQIYGVEIGERNILAAVLAMVCFYFFAEVKGLYDSWRLGSIVAEIADLITAWGIVVAVLVVLAFASKTSANFSRLVIVTWFLIAPFVLSLARIAVRNILREMRRAGKNTRTLAVIGANTQGLRLIEKAQNAPWMGMHALGLYDDLDIATLSTEVRACFQGTVNELMQEVRNGGVDYVYIALPMQEENRIVELVSTLADTTASVYVVPNMFVSNLVQAKWTNFYGIPAIRIFETPFMGVDSRIKQLEDFILGSVFLVMAALPMLLIALAVRLTSPGPIIFKQRRYGLNGEVVEIWKFRTMTVCEDGENVPQAQRDDKRITPMGGFLRRTSLDELPQLVNVLQGRMSLVGPRPHAVAHNEQYRKLIHGYMLRHKVKPGITGWAQVNGWRGETDTLDKMEKRIEYDLEYIRNWSFWLDLKILWLTIYRGFSSKNAY